MKAIFCYGSNNPTQLQDRVGHVDKKNMIKCFADGWMRTFRGYSQKWGGGVATLIKKSGASCYGYIANLSDDQVEILNEYEGTASGHYVLKPLTVTTDYGDKKAYAYLATAKEYNEPSKAYLNAIAKTVGAFWTNGDGSKITSSDITIKKNPRNNKITKLLKRADAILKKY